MDKPNQEHDNYTELHRSRARFNANWHWL